MRKKKKRKTKSAPSRRSKKQGLKEVKFPSETHQGRVGENIKAAEKGGTKKPDHGNDIRRRETASKEGQ